MNSYPLIGITTSARDERGRFYLAAAYVEAVRRAGGLPVLLPHGEPHLAELAAKLDGVILSGGGDVEPSLYGGQPHETIYMVDLERDRTEIELAQRLVKWETPILSICRGIQVLNVALGGTLVEHLPDEVGEEISHRGQPPRAVQHEVIIDPEAHLARVVGQDRVTVASWHHQSVRQAAPGLRVVAKAPDGTIEAVEAPDHPWLIGVQWHPELTAIEDPSQQRLFDGLVEAAARRMANR
jgi:putative glutamine amidotransferase